MTWTVEHLIGGTWSGSGGTPNSGNAGAITTDGPNREVVIVCFSGRENTSADYQRVTAISAAGLTFAHSLSQDFTWTDSAADVNFPVASMHMDVFTALAPTQLTALAWSSTVTGDGFINNSACYVISVAGASATGPLDTNASNFKFADNVSGVSNSPSVSGFSTDGSDVLLLMPILQHALGGASAPVTVPTGWTDGGTINSAGGAASNFSSKVAYLATTKQNAATVTAASSATDWATAMIALSAASSPAPTGPTGPGQKHVRVLAGPTGPTGTVKGVRILNVFTGPTGTFPVWNQISAAQQAQGPTGTFEEVYNSGTGASGTFKTVIIPGYSSPA